MNIHISFHACYTISNKTTVLTVLIDEDNRADTAFIRPSCVAAPLEDAFLVLGCCFIELPLYAVWFVPHG